MFKNNGDPPKHSIHGGQFGFHTKIWSPKIIPNGVELSYLSEDMEEGYPGNLQVTIKYEIVENELKITYSARTDKKTVINLTNHAYSDFLNSRPYFVTPFL